MKVNFDTIIVFVFYLILIGVIVVQFNKVFNSQTAFEEYELFNDTKLPSFTLCPYPKNPFKSIGTFEEAMLEIENAKEDYSMKMHKTKPFQKR